MHFYNGRIFDCHFLKCATVRSVTIINSQMCENVADIEGRTYGGTPKINNKHGRFGF